MCISCTGFIQFIVAFEGCLCDKQTSAVVLIINFLFYGVCASAVSKRRSFSSLSPSLSLPSLPPPLALSLSPLSPLSLPSLSPLSPPSLLSIYDTKLFMWKSVSWSGGILGLVVIRVCLSKLQLPCFQHCDYFWLLFFWLLSILNSSYSVSKNGQATLNCCGWELHPNWLACLSIISLFLKVLSKFIVDCKRLDLSPHWLSHRSETIVFFNSCSNICNRNA